MGQLRAYEILDRRHRERDGLPPTPSDIHDEDDNDDDGCGDEEEEEKGSYYYESLLYYQRHRGFTHYGGPAAITSSLAEPSSRSTDDLKLPPQRRVLYHALLGKLEHVGTTIGQSPGQTMAVVKSEQQDILAAIGMLLVMEEDEFGLWAGLYGNLHSKLYEREAHWDVKHPAKARQILETWVQRKRLMYSDVCDADLRHHEREELGRAKDSIYLAEIDAYDTYHARCIVSWDDITDVFPLFPDFLTADKMEALWHDLSWFWPSNCVQDWRVAAAASLHTTTNLVPINVSLIPAWACAEIAFRPLSDDGRDMYLHFYDLSPPESEDEILEYNLRRTMVRGLYNRRREDFIHHPVRSGDILHLHTNNKDRCPLPDFRLFKLQWHLNRAWCAAVRPRLLRILFDDNGYDDSAERDGYRPATTKYDPCPSHTPWFTHLLIDCAVKENIISRKDVPLWKARLDPDGEIRDGGHGWIYFDFGEWKHLADPSGFTEWEFVEGYDDDRNPVINSRGHSNDEAE